MYCTKISANSQVSPTHKPSSTTYCIPANLVFYYNFIVITTTIFAPLQDPYILPNVWPSKSLLLKKRDLYRFHAIKIFSCIKALMYRPQNLPQFTTFFQNVSNRVKIRAHHFFGFCFYPIGIKNLKIGVRPNRVCLFTRFRISGNCAHTRPQRFYSPYAYNFLPIAHSEKRCFSYISAKYKACTLWA